MVRQKTSLNEIRTKIETRGKYLREVFHVQEVGIFGSYVTGRQTLRSDIDVLVTFEQGYKDFFNYMKLKCYLEELLGNKVDLVIKEAVKERLRKRILDEVVYVR